MSKMPYAVFAESKLVALCNTLSEAISTMPKNSDETHIYNEDMEEVTFFKRGKPNGEIRINK